MSLQLALCEISLSQVGLDEVSFLLPEGLYDLLDSLY